MNPAQIIARKRDGESLTAEQIATFVEGYACGSIADYQMSALAMAIYLRGMLPEETAALTDAMLNSGTTLEWLSAAPKVDKHSTGGVGDKVSLVLAPLLACCGVQVPMISGRGLGPTGGTLDKLESIPGFRTDLSTEEMVRVTEQVGCVITDASSDIAPADKKLYALRDVTGTVASIPLITASIMSKKLAENLDALVLDVKFGSGAFMKSLDDARQLAQSLVETGKRCGVKTSALLTDMNQPLGRMIGNAVEVQESIDALKGGGPDDLRELTIELAAESLVLAGRHTSDVEAKSELHEHLQSGRGFDKFAEMVAAQGGDLRTQLHIAPKNKVVANRSGFAAAIDTQRLGEAITQMGGGRRVMTDAIDRSAGMEVLVRLGDKVTADQPLVYIYADSGKTREITPAIQQAISISDHPSQLTELIVERVS